MRPTNHITDVQLNEYLDHETDDHTQIELHLASCADCAARLSSLSALFDEIESLSELNVSHDISAQVTRRLSGRASLPRSLRLAVTLQAAVAIVAMLFIAPFVMKWVSPYISSLKALSLVDGLMQLQAEWTILLSTLSQFQLPALSQLPVAEISSLFLLPVVIAVSVLWVLGNGLLLRNRTK